MDLLAGALDEEARRALDAHLDQCAACTQLVADLADLVEEEPPPEGRDAARVDPDDTPRPRAPRGAPRVGGRYQVLGLLGSGGMGSVYEAFDEALGRKVALKVLRADVVDSELREERSTRLRREARLLAAIHHPNVLSVYDVGTWDGQVFMAVQMVEGSTLGAWIREAAPTWREILEVYLKVGEGLAEAHRQGLVHRDVKPDNILIDATGRAWLADFGLACAIGGDVLISSDEGEGEEALALSAVTRTGVIMGTPAYMAPEQHLGERADDRADQFSFAAALFEGLYGTRAFEGRTRPRSSSALRLDARAARRARGAPSAPQAPPHPGRGAPGRGALDLHRPPGHVDHARAHARRRRRAGA